MSLINDTQITMQENLDYEQLSKWAKNNPSKEICDYLDANLPGWRYINDDDFDPLNFDGGFIDTCDSCGQDAEAATPGWCKRCLRRRDTPLCDDDDSDDEDSEPEFYRFNDCQCCGDEFDNEGDASVKLCYECLKSHEPETSACPPEPDCPPPEPDCPPEPETLPLCANCGDEFDPRYLWEPKKIYCRYCVF